MNLLVLCLKGLLARDGSSRRGWGFPYAFSETGVHFETDGDLKGFRGYPWE